jgi:hypothetical protein
MTEIHLPFEFWKSAAFIHCHALWETIFEQRVSNRSRMKPRYKEQEEEEASREDNSDRREWLVYATKEEEQVAEARHREEKLNNGRRSHHLYSTDGFRVETWGKKKSLAGWWRLFCSGHGDDFGKEGLVTTYPNDLYCKRVTTCIVKGFAT